MRGDGRLGLLILAVGIAPALIKKSKPMARYVGDQLIRAGEYLKVGTEEAEPKEAKEPEAATEEPESAAEPKEASTEEPAKPKGRKKAAE